MLGGVCVGRGCVCVWNEHACVGMGVCWEGSVCVLGGVCVYRMSTCVLGGEYVLMGRECVCAGSVSVWKRVMGCH